MPGWTLDTLYLHLSALAAERDARYGQRFTDLETATQAALAASEKAVDKAESATEKRFEGVNEFRGALADRTAEFVTRSESEAVMVALRERVDELTNRLNRSEGKGAGLNAGWVYLLAAIAAVGTIVSLYVALAHK
jgi:hypothetical protein